MALLALHKKALLMFQVNVEWDLILFTKKELDLSK